MVPVSHYDNRGFCDRLAFHLDVRSSEQSATRANTNDPGMIAKARVWTPGSQTTRIGRGESLFELEQTKP